MTYLMRWDLILAVQRERERDFPAGLEEVSCYAMRRPRGDKLQGLLKLREWPSADSKKGLR